MPGYFHVNWHLSCLYMKMNIKRIFGSILTLLGIVGLVYGAILFVNNGGGTREIKALVIYILLGFIFFMSGIGLIKATKDEG